MIEESNINTENSIKNHQQSFWRLLKNNMNRLLFAALIVILTFLICVGVTIINHVNTIPVFIIVIMIMLLGGVSYITKKKGGRIIFGLLTFVFILALVDVVSEVIFPFRKSTILTHFHKWENDGHYDREPATDLRELIQKDISREEEELTQQGEQELKKGNRKRAIEIEKQIRDLKYGTDQDLRTLDQMNIAVYAKNVNPNLKSENTEVKNTQTSIVKNFSQSGIKEVVSLTSSKQSRTSKIFLSPGQRFRVKATSQCWVGNSNSIVEPGIWIGYTQTEEGYVDYRLLGSPGGRLEFEVL